MAFGRLPVITVPCPHGLGEQIADLMQAHGLTSYDAAYLAVAIAEGLPLASFDAVLRRAASATGVALWGEAVSDADAP
jgi:predicted nucleic acid-binding protein